MHFKPTLTNIEQRSLLKLWGFDTGEILDITAFGDLFIKTDEGIIYISLTDGEIKDVSELISEFGLPPVSLDLGDEWYQLSTQNVLQEAGLGLEPGECFAFTQPIFEGGEYSDANISVTPIIEYHNAMRPLIKTIK